MLRYTLLAESSAVAVRRPSRALVVTNRRFASAAAPGAGKPLRRTSNDEKPMSSLELAFKKRLEATKLANQSKQSSASGNNGGGWLSANAEKSKIQPQTTQQTRSTGNQSDRNRMDNAFSNRNQQNNGNRVVGGTFQRNIKPNNTDFQKLPASAIRERLAQRTGVQPKTGNNGSIGPISEVGKFSSSMRQQQQRERTSPPRNNKRRPTPSIRGHVVTSDSQSGSFL